MRICVQLFILGLALFLGGQLQAQTEGQALDSQHAGRLVVVRQDAPILDLDDGLTEGYLHVFSSPTDELFLRPGLCETGTAELLLVQYVPTQFPKWEDFGQIARSALSVTGYWRDHNCGAQKTLNVTMHVVFDGVAYAEFTATIIEADRISSPAVTLLAETPAPTTFSDAISRLRLENFVPRLPDEWTRGSPPGISSKGDARYAHTVFVEGLTAKPSVSEWSDESLELLHEASEIGHRGATHQLLDHVQFTNTVSRIFYNLSQGNEPIEQNMRDVLASHGALFERAVAQRIGQYVTLQAAFEEYNYSLTGGLIALNEGAPPNHYELTTALNAKAQDVLNPVSKGYMELLGLPTEAGWQCDGEWCVGTGGLARLRLVARSKGLDCTLTTPDIAQCSFDMAHVIRGHQALEGTAQQQLLDTIMAPSRVVPRRAEAELTRQNGSWKINGLINLEPSAAE